MEQPIYSRILISTQQIQQTVALLARQIEQVYTEDEEVVALVVLEGARQFAEDLLNEVRHPITMRYIRASSYHGGTKSTGQVELDSIESLANEIAGKQVLVIDDIYDTGLTLSVILKRLSCYGAAEVRTCVLLVKQAAHERPVAIDFAGMDIEDAFVIGYGLDYEGRYRDLPFIAVLSEKIIKGESIDG